MPERIDVFISSTARDLKKYRDKVKDAVLNAGAFPLAMEEFDATERNALQKCYDEVCQAEIFIGIYAHRYGFAPGEDMLYTSSDGDARAGDGVTSITEWEYRWAVERRLPMLLYVVSEVDEDGEPLPWVQSYIDGEPERSRLSSFKQSIMGSHVVGFFLSPDDLARQVAGALPKLLTRFETGDGQSAPAGRRDFYRHVNLPANYVSRPELVAGVRAALLARDDGIALHGMGGIGKSVVARALCEDAEIQAAFPDGILWVSLGQDAHEDDLKGKLRAWVDTLGGVIGDAAPSIERLKETVAALLADRACLLVIDDVWRRRDAEFFLAGGARCRLLVTTRDAEVAHALGVPVEPIPLMTDDEAAALLDQWSDGALATADRALRRRIVADTLGRLPLAIRLAGAQLRGRSPNDWLKAFDARRLAARRPESLHDSLALTFGLSLDALSPTDRALYAALAIFKEDEPIQTAAIRRLWAALGGLDGTSSADLLTDLAARALLEISQTSQSDSTGGSSGDIILHDLLREFVRAELPDPAAAHAALLDAYRKTWRGHGWHSAPDDGYLYHHLVFHLMAAGDAAAVRALFHDDRWLNARVAAAGYVYDGYIADLQAAWFDLIEPGAYRQIAAQGDSFSDYAELARYALIRTTINSLASNHVRALVVRAVEVRLEGWTPARALSIARHMANVQHRANLYAELLKTGMLNAAQRRLAQENGLNAARSLHDPARRVVALARMIATLEGSQREEVISEALKHLEGVTESRIFAAASLIDVMRIEDGRAALLEQIVVETLALRHDKTRAETLIRLAPLLTPDQHVAALEVAVAFDNERYAADVLEALMPYLSDVVLDRAREAADHLRFPGFRVRVYAALARRLPVDDPARQECIDLARADVMTDMDWWVAVAALAALVQVVEGAERQGILDQAFTVAEEVNSPRSRLRALTTLAHVLRPSDTYWLSLCLSEAKRLVADDDSLADLFAALAEKLDKADRDYVIAVASSFEGSQARSVTLVAYAPMLDREALGRALSLNYRIHDERAQVEAVASLARALPDAEAQAALSRALELVTSIRDERLRGRAIAPLMSIVEGDLKTKAFSLLREISDSPALLKNVLALTRNLAEDGVPAVLEIARSIPELATRIEALASLGAYLTPEERAELTRLIAGGGERFARSAVYLELTTARNEQDAAIRDEAASRALEYAARIPSALLRAWSVAEIAREFSGDAVDAAIDTALEEVMAVRNEWSRASSLAALSAVLRPDQVERAAHAAAVLGDPWAQIWGFAAFANLDAAPPARVAEFRRMLLDYLRNRTDVKRESKLQFLTARSIYRAPTFDQDTLAELARVIISICWDWRWL